MNYRRYNNKNKDNINICILMATVLLVIILPCAVRANSYSSNIKRNLFYVQVLNQAMPAVKATVFSEDDMAENGFSIVKTAVKIMGVNLGDPMSVVGREAAYLSLDSGILKDKTNVKFNHFKLEDKSVSKDNLKDKPPAQENLNLENKVVNEYDPSLKKTLNTSKPEVLIYHTHTTEGYKPANAISSDNTKNVCAVGDALANELQSKYGISVIHDKTVHDAEAYTQSYARSAVTVDKYMKQYKDFKLVIDLHRDSVPDKRATTIKLNGENAAKIMFVMARKNPHFNNNMALANKMIQTSDKLFPGFCKGVLYYNYGTRYFNQDKSNNAVLIEMGSDINEVEEVKASTKYLSRLIAESLNKK